MKKKKKEVVVIVVVVRQRKRGKKKRKKGRKRITNRVFVPLRVSKYNTQTSKILLLLYTAGRCLRAVQLFFFFFFLDYFRLVLYDAHKYSARVSPGLEITV